jgi:hypothetical protein
MPRTKPPARREYDLPPVDHIVQAKVRKTLTADSTMCATVDLTWFDVESRQRLTERFELWYIGFEMVAALLYYNSSAQARQDFRTHVLNHIELFSPRD